MEWFYRLLLRCYPGEFRDEYEREMLELFRERASHDRRMGVAAMLRLWWQVIVDSVVRAPTEHWDVLRQDARYAIRSLRRAPTFALTAVLTLALGVGANTAIFSVVHAVAMRPLPYDPEGRVIRVWENNPGLSITEFAVSLPNYVSWRERARTVELGAWMNGSTTLRSTGDPVRVGTSAVSANFFSVLGIRPVQGRLFTAADEALKGEPVAVITEGLWRTHFGGDPAILGKSIAGSVGAPTVIGVIDEGRLPIDAEFFTPLRIDLGQEDRGNHLAHVIGSLGPGVGMSQARSEMEEIARQLETEFPASNKGWGVSLESAFEAVVSEETRRALYVILGAVFCVLVIACANVANLMLVRAAGRKREVAVRLAIGAASRRLLRQVLTEGMVLIALGGAVGVLLAYWSVPVLRQWLPASLARAEEASVNGPVLVFTLAVCMVTGLIFAVLPAFAGASTDLVESLKEGARGSTGAAARWRQVLAVGQVAVATVMLVVAGLFVQSLHRLQQVELGFDPTNVTTAMMGLANDRYKDPHSKWAFYQRMLDRLQAGPGIEATAITSGAPFDGGNTGMPVSAVGSSRLQGKPLQADWRMVSPGYFQALRIPLLRGSTFTGHSGADERSLIVSATMARRIWGDENPIGRQIAADPNGTFTVIGVVADVRNLDLALAPAPTMYISTSRYTWATMTVVVRSAGSLTQTAAFVRRTIRELDPQLALFNVAQIADQIDRSASQPRLNARLVGAFAVIAGLLAALGLYGVLASLVSQKRQEIGIRLALGAGGSAVLGLFVRRGLGLAGAGLLWGVAGALAASRWLGSMMFGVSARDPLTFGVTVALVAVVALIATYIPARRAARVDPLIALRAD